MKMHSALELYPLTFAPILTPRPWGGERLGQSIDGVPVGESWLFSPLESHITPISNGCYQGMRLDELIARDAEAYLGPRLAARALTDLPILIKLIDTAQPLSVQVHPSDQTAPLFAGAQPKNEWWYILDAGEDAFLYAGLQRTTTPEALVEACLSGTLDQVLGRHRARPGDQYYIPGGQIHAIGPHLLLLEVQQPSDTTFRLHDWNRVDSQGRGRQLHIAQALKAATLTPYPDDYARSAVSAPGSLSVTEDPHFTIICHPAFPAPGAPAVSAGEDPRLLFTLGSGLEIRYGGGKVLTVPRGTLCFLPAGLAFEGIGCGHRCPVIEIRLH